MSTRADFYVGRGADCIEWLGSIAMDGYPRGLAGNTWLNPLDATSEADYRSRVTMMFAERDDATRAEQGWPWPWIDSRRTNYVYTFADERVLVMAYANGWMTVAQATELADAEDDMPEFPEREDADDMTVPSRQFPNMVARQNVTFGTRSGLTVFVTSEIEM